MFLVSALNSYIYARRVLNGYIDDLVFVNKTPTTAVGGATTTNTNKRRPSTIDASMSSPNQHHTNSREMLELERELQALQSLALKTPTTTTKQQQAVAKTPATEPKEVQLLSVNHSGAEGTLLKSDTFAGIAHVTSNCTSESVLNHHHDKLDDSVTDENSVTPTAQNTSRATGRFAYSSSRRLNSNASLKGGNTSGTNAPNAAPYMATKTISKNALGTINSNTRTEPRRWRVNQKPVENLSTDEVAVALLSKFA